MAILEDIIRLAWVSAWRQLLSSQRRVVVRYNSLWLKDIIWRLRMSADCRRRCLYAGKLLSAV